MSPYGGIKFLCTFEENLKPVAFIFFSYNLKKIENKLNSGKSPSKISNVMNGPQVEKMMTIY